MAYNRSNKFAILIVIVIDCCHRLGLISSTNESARKASGPCFLSTMGMNPSISQLTYLDNSLCPQ